MNKFLTEKERMCPTTVMNAVMETIKSHGNAVLDCGHQTTKEVVLKQQEDGQFIALCEKCGSK